MSTSSSSTNTNKPSVSPFSLHSSYAFILYGGFAILAFFNVTTVKTMHDTDMANLEGYWGQKTSSVNFCELDYEHTPYVAEFWNMLSSFAMILLPLFGVFHSNPTKEWRFFVAYMVLTTVGVGSVSLHTCLTAFTQSCDEVPMLWMCTAIFYCLWDSKTPQNSNNKLKPVGMSMFAVFLTVSYFHIQDLYHIFVGGYLTLVFGILIWTARLAWNDHSIKKFLWLSSITFYVLIGCLIWLIDFKFCDSLQLVHKVMMGATFHVVWHAAAAIATYMTILLLIVVRIEDQKLGTPTLSWCLGVLPVISVIPYKKI